MQLFYSNNIHENVIELNEEESRHVKVLRKNIGDQLWITDGQGSMYECRITATGKKVKAEIINRENQEQEELKIHVAVSPTKNLDRMEWMVEKMTEIGIHKISFIHCHHSERKVFKTERVKKKALSAMKQSKRCFLPEIAELEKFKSFASSSTANQKFIAHCEDSNLKAGFGNLDQSGEVLVLIGPEGDFSPEEINLSKENNFKELSLGKAILRTETAGMLVTTLLNHCS